MSEWREFKLGEVIEVKYGKDHKKMGEGTIPCYGSGGLMRYVDDYIYDDESILIPRKGSLQKILYENKPFWTVDTMFWSKINKNIVSPKFLFYKLKLIDFENLNVGSAVPSLTVPVINDVDITIPSLTEQKAIASVLSSLDDKIDLLHRQNETLEKMAETFFRQWFVEEAKDDWEEVKLGDIIEIGSGKSLKKEFFNDNGKYPVLGANGRIGKTNEFLFNEKLIYTGRVGTLGNVFIIDNEKVWLSDNTVIVKPKISFYLIYFFLKNLKLENYDVGSTQPLIRQSDIKDIDIKKPDTIKLNLFEEFSKNIFNKIKTNQKQNQTLTNLRDTLLPKLMSGEVRVEI